MKSLLRRQNDYSCISLHNNIFSSNEKYIPSSCLFISTMLWLLFPFSLMITSDLFILSKKERRIEDNSRRDCTSEEMIYYLEEKSLERVLNEIIWEEKYVYCYKFE